MKRRALTLAVAATLLAVGWLTLRPDRPLRIATGAVSHTLCSAAFVSGLDPQQVYAEEIESAAPFQPIRWAIRYSIDPVQREVETTLLGTFGSRAIYREGFGCLVLRGAQLRQYPSFVKSEAPSLPRLAELVQGDKDVLAVLDRAFALHSSHWLKAVVVMRDERVIAERYAPGYGPDTRVLGWSVTKSVLNALTGILVRKGRLKVEQLAPVGEWSNPSDPRHPITVDQLLRMRSGLDIAEKHGPFDPVSRMIFLEEDMGTFAARSPLRAPPGTTYAYSSGNYLILSRIIRDATGGNAPNVLEFVRRELFEPLGMESAMLEFDSTGTPIGSTYMYATARDWARFGTLYLDDGMANGKRILPSGWVRYSTAAAPDGGYAAGFEYSSQHNRELGIPSDAFFAEGFLGQELAIIPSERVVIARFGAIDDNWGDLNPFVAGILSALHKSAN